jgi:hypothetical protein
MKKIFLGAALALVACPLTFAGTLSNQMLANCAVASDCTISGIGLTGSLSVTAEGRKSDLKLVGAGLRSKVFILSLPIYVAQLYATNPSQVDRSPDKVVDSLASQPTVAMTLTFLYEASGDEIQGAFQDALESNGIDPSSDQLSQLLDAVLKGGRTKKGKTMTFVGETLADGTTAVTFESTQGNPVTIHGDKDFVRQVMSLWLGDTSQEEKELQKLKIDLLRDRKLN